MAARLRILSKAPKFKTALHDSIMKYLTVGGERLFFKTERAKKIFTTMREHPSSDPITLLLSFIQNLNIIISNSNKT